MTVIKVGSGNYDEMMRVLQVELHDDASDRLAEMGRILEAMIAEGRAIRGFPPCAARLTTSRASAVRSAIRRWRRSRTAWRTTSTT